MESEGRKYLWHETNRRLSDGIRIRVTPVTNLPDWINVSVNSEEGYFLFQGMMRLWESVTELPYQLDRAREFDREFRAASQISQVTND